MQVALPPSEIVQRQDERERRQLVAAWKWLYGQDKRRNTFWFLVSVGFAALAVLAAASPASVGAVMSFLALLVAPLELVIQPFLTRARVAAATVQEKFDCEVLQMPWNEAMADRPGMRVVELAAKAYFARTPPQEAERATHNWYENRIAHDPKQPLWVARLACQHENVRWDSQQRRQFAWLLLGAIGVIALAVGVYAVLTDAPARQLLAGPVILLSPLVVALTRLAAEHLRVAAQKERLYDVLAALMREAKGASVDEADLLARTRNVQTEIYHSRANDTPVPDWFYKRTKQQNQPPETMTES